MIAITGATGEIGRRVAARLSKRGAPLRLIVRNALRAPQLPNASLSRIDSYADTSAMGKALSGIRTLFLVSAQDKMGAIQRSIESGLPMPDYDRVQQHKAAVTAAVAAGVERIVYLSFLNASRDATFILSRDHFYTEEIIRNSGLKFTFLRPNLYMDKVPALIAGGDFIKAPAGEGRISWVSRDDIADVAAEVLTATGHNGNTYDITGPEALTMHETAERLAEASGRKIVYIPQTPEETRLMRNASRMDAFEKNRRHLTGQGMTDFEVEVWTTHYLQIATGEVAAVCDTVERVCGRPAESLAAYLKKHALP